MSSTFDTIADIIADTCNIERATITAAEPCDRRPRHRQPRLPRRDLRDRQEVRDQAAVETWTQDVSQGKAKPSSISCSRTSRPRSTSWWPRRADAHAARILPDDRSVTALDAVARTIVCESRVPDESPVRGPFPRPSLMPGVLLIETMAQASGYLVLATTRFERMPFLIGVEGAKLRTFVEPARRSPSRRHSRTRAPASRSRPRGSRRRRSASATPSCASASCRSRTLISSPPCARASRAHRLAGGSGRMSGRDDRRHQDRPRHIARRHRAQRPSMRS